MSRLFACKPELHPEQQGPASLHRLPGVTALPASEPSANHPPGETGESWVLGQTGRVQSLAEDGAIRLADGSLVLRAPSCLLVPQPGDRVLLVRLSDTAPLILAILQRASSEIAQVQVPGADHLRLCQTELSLEASRRLGLRSLRDAELSAATGTLRLSARNLFTTVLETLVETAADRLSKVGSFMLEARRLLRLHGRHGLVTAEKNIRMDAEQIHIG